MAATITRPYTLQPIQQSLHDALADFAFELEGEGNLESDVLETTLQEVTTVLTVKCSYDPVVVRQAFLSAAQQIH